MVNAVAAVVLRAAAHPTQYKATRDLKGDLMRGLKSLIGATALFAGLAMTPQANAQIVIEIGNQPACSYGYYDYQPYACAPYGFYGPGYFYNGIFLGMGPWAGWGYGHGWGGHRFDREDRGSYHGGGGAAANRSHYAGGQGMHNGGGGQIHGNGAPSQQNGSRPPTGHPQAPRGAAPQHNSAPHDNGGGRPSGGGHPQGGGGGGGRHGGHDSADEKK